jgi:hypothetical protein
MSFENDDCFWKYSAFKEIREMYINGFSANKAEIIRKSLEFQVLSPATALICKFKNIAPMAGGSSKTMTIAIESGSTLKQLMEAIQVAMDIPLERNIGFFNQKGIRLISSGFAAII